MKTLSEAKATLLHKSATREAYDAMEAEFSVVHELIAARIHAGLTQSEVAQRMGTTQSVIAPDGKWSGATLVAYPDALCPGRGLQRIGEADADCLVGLSMTWLA